MVDADTGATDFVFREGSESARKRQRRLEGAAMSKVVELQQHASSSMAIVKKEKVELQCQVNAITDGMGYETHQKMRRLRAEAANNTLAEECDVCFEQRQRCQCGAKLKAPFSCH